MTHVEKLPETVYDSTSDLKNPAKAFTQIVLDLFRSRELIWVLYLRDLRASHRQSLLGLIWMFIPVLSTTLLWTCLSEARVVAVAPTEIPYTLHVLIGSIIWTLFVSCMNQPLSSFNACQSVIMKLKVPPEAFIAASFLSVLTDLFIRLTLLLPVFLFFSFTPALTWPLFFLGLLSSALFGTALGLLMIPLGSLYGDISRIANTATTMGMYLTPVIFPPPKSGIFGWLVNINPMTSIVVMTRDWLTLGHGEYLLPFTIVTITSLFIIIVGMVIFRATLPHLIERMGM